MDLLAKISSKSRKISKCSGCDKFGHTRRSCPSLKKSERLQCGVCLEYGHTARKCDFALKMNNRFQAGKFIIFYTFRKTNKGWVSKELQKPLRMCGCFKEKSRCRDDLCIMKSEFSWAFLHRGDLKYWKTWMDEKSVALLMNK